MAHVIAKSVASRLFRFFIVAFRYISKDHNTKTFKHIESNTLPWQILVCSSYMGVLVLSLGLYRGTSK